MNLCRRTIHALGLLSQISGSRRGGESNHEACDAQRVRYDIRSIHVPEADPCLISQSQPKNTRMDLLVPAWFSNLLVQTLLRPLQNSSHFCEYNFETGLVGGEGGIKH